MIAPCPAGPWVKALAVTPAVAASRADVIVVADADCWTDGLPAAIDAVAAGAPWAIPHTGVFRLDEHGTTAVLQGARWDDQPLTQRPYRGIPGGGFVVAHREVIEQVPLDSRFVGWGQEDECWAVALSTLVGAPWRGHEPLIHLYHPSQERLTRRKGSLEGWELRRRYIQARGNAPAMAVLLEEAKTHAAIHALESAGHDHPPVPVG